MLFVSSLAYRIVILPRTGSKWGWLVETEAFSPEEES